MERGIEEDVCVGGVSRSQRPEEPRKEGKRREGVGVSRTEPFNKWGLDKEAVITENCQGLAFLSTEQAVIAKSQCV